MVSGSLKVNRDIIVANKRHRLRERQSNTPREAVLALAEMTPNPPNVLNTIHERDNNLYNKVTLIGQINRTPVYDPVTTAITMRDAGADAVSFFTDHAIYKQDYEDALLVTRGLRQTPVIFQNYILNDYGVIAARAAGIAAVTLYGTLLEPEEMRQLVSLAQRWRMVVVCQVDTLEYLDFALGLSPHAIAYGDPIMGDFMEDSALLRTHHPRIPAYTQFLFAYAFDSMVDIHQALTHDIDAIIVSHRVFGDTKQHRQLKSLLERV